MAEQDAKRAGDCTGARGRAWHALSAMRGLLLKGQLGALLLAVLALRVQTRPAIGRPSGCVPHGPSFASGRSARTGEAKPRGQGGQTRHSPQTQGRPPAAAATRLRVSGEMAGDIRQVGPCMSCGGCGDCLIGSTDSYVAEPLPGLGGRPCERSHPEVTDGSPGARTPASARAQLQMDG